MSLRSPFPRRAYTFAAAGLMAIAYAAGPLGSALAVTVNGSTFSNHSHDQFQAGDTPRSPYFTTSVNSTSGEVYTLIPANGLAGSIAAPGGTPTGSSTTVSGTVTINGTATSLGADLAPDTPDDWLDGNQIPAGISLALDATFTISSANGNTLLTATGNTGNGLGISNDNVETHGSQDAGEVLNISAITTSNHQWAGAPTEAFTFTPGAVGVTKFGGFRSNNFVEASEGATLSDGTNTWGFGTSTGTVASNLLMENNFNAANLFSPAGGDVALTLTTDVGAWNLKGFQLRTPVSYEITAAPAADADFDNDGDVDGADFLIWQQNITDAGATPDQGDADGNGTVDGVDLAAWGAQYGPPAGPLTAIPEPASAALALIGLLVAARVKRA